MILPPFEESILDKIILLKAVKRQFPVTINTIEERNKFGKDLLQELPAFLFFLSQWKIPVELKCDRFGITHYHHPELVSELETYTPENDLLDIIDNVLFKSNQSEVFWKGTARELEGRLKMSLWKNEVERILSFNNAMGTYLGKLQIKLPKRVKGSRTSDNRSWMIVAPL
jgi:hypothetical protein